MEIISKSQQKMKTTKKIIFILTAGLFLFVSCDRHDAMDDAVIVGQMAPQVYWEPASSTVKAGDSISFTAQYYTTGTEAIDRLEIWYNVVEDESKAVTCPWTQTFTYSITSNKTNERRISQKVSTYPHREDYWDVTYRAYKFSAKFPSSNTLSTVTWTKPASFDSEKMSKYFGNNFTTQFKDSLYKLMKVKDFQKMYLGLSLVDNFTPYLDSVKNDNTGGWDYVFPKDSQGNRPIPQILVDIYKTIPFEDLIFNKTDNIYSVEYNKSYRINANIKAFDKKGVTGIGTSKEISLN